VSDALMVVLVAVMGLPELVQLGEVKLVVNCN